MSAPTDAGQREHARHRPTYGFRGRGVGTRMPVTACSLQRHERRLAGLPLMPSASAVSVTLAVVVCAVAVVVAFGLAVGGIAASPAGTNLPVPERTEVVTVQPGETLWDLASSHAPGSDPREVVQHIRELNESVSGAVPVGAVLTVPSRDSTPVGE